MDPTASFSFFLANEVKEGKLEDNLATAVS